MLKLAYFCSEYPSRSHTFIRREIQELNKRGANIDVFALRRPQKENLLSNSDVQAFNQTVSVLPINIIQLALVHIKLLLNAPLSYFKTLLIASKHHMPGIKNTLWAFFQFAEAIVLAEQLKNKNIEHLHVHFANSGASIGFFAAHYLDIGWSMTLHGTSCFDFPSGPLLGKKIEYCTFANCISYFGLSQAYRSVAPQYWSKLFVSRCGIETDAIQLAKDKAVATNKIKTKQSDSPLRIISVGRLHVEKGFPIMIHAFAEALKIVPNLELVLLGDGPYGEELRAFVKQQGLQDKVVFKGAVAEQTALDEMGVADIFALSSFMEGIPMVLMEAMVLEVPVIAPRIAGIPELVVHQENGLLFDPAHKGQMAECMIELVKSKTKRAKYGKAGKEKVLSEFVIEKSVENLWQRFMQL